MLDKVIEKGNVIIVDKHETATTPQEIQDYFDSAKEKGLEGLILKKPSAPYQAGARSFAWVKYKVADEKLLDDTVDCVILGYYHGRGERATIGIGGFLAGIYDKKTNTYKTLTKVGTGLSEQDFAYLKKEADMVETSNKPKEYNVHKNYEADVWLSPKIVIELAGDEISKSQTHSLGYALRFPRLIKFRADKGAKDTTSVDEILYLHKNQKRGYY